MPVRYYLHNAICNSNGGCYFAVKAYEAYKLNVIHSDLINHDWRECIMRSTPFRLHHWSQVSLSPSDGGQSLVWMATPHAREIIIITFKFDHSIVPARDLSAL